MEDWISCFQDLEASHKVAYIVGGCVVCAVSALVLKRLLEKRKVYPRDTVILHQIGRGPYAPSLTPYAVKLETYLRMAKIPYQSVHDFKPSPKGKFPWIEYNGQEVADTTLCINFLNKKLGVDLNKHLSSSERGVAQAMQTMGEEHLYWCVALHRWCYDNDKTLLIKAFNMNVVSTKLVFWMVRRKISDQAYKQGLGRHTVEEVNQFMEKDLQALDNWIGSKKFMMGTNASEVDCAVFGLLSQLYWHPIGEGHDTLLQEKYPRLAAHCERMKTTFWPDWDQCITHGGTKEATK